MILSRYHWDLITVWTRLVLLDEKPKISFAPIWHTPIVHCVDYEPYWNVPQDANLLNKAKALRLFTSLNIFILKSNIQDKFNSMPISYADILTEDEVDKKYKFSSDEITSMVIIGSSSDLPPHIREEITRILRS